MKRLLLHIGTGKTGTSSIQNFLFANRKQLSKHFSCFYPEYGMTKADHFGQLIHAHYPIISWITNRDTTHLAELNLELQSSNCETAILSCENLYHHLTPEDIAYFAEQFRDFSIEVICYVRRQDLYIESAWKQQVKVGALKTPFPIFLQRHTQAKFLDEVHANYYKMLIPWASVFGIPATHVKLFDKSEWKNGSLTDDFLDACGIDVKKGENILTKLTSTNIGLPSELIRLVQKTNAMGIIPKNQQKDFISYLGNLNSFDNPPLLSEEDRMAVINNYHSTNHFLFSEFCNRPIPDCFFYTPKSSISSNKINRTLPLEDIAIKSLVAVFEQSKPLSTQAKQLWKQAVGNISKDHPKSLPLPDESINSDTEFNGWSDKIINWTICKSTAEHLLTHKQLDVGKHLPDLKKVLIGLTRLVLQPINEEYAKEKSIAACRLFSNGKYELLIQMDGPRLSEILMRLLPLSIYFEKLVTTYPYLEGIIPISLADEPKLDLPLLAFCSNKPSHQLIPDSYFVRTNGHNDYRNTVEKNWIRWEKRAAKAYWRGSSTGNKNGEQRWREMPRFQLCQLAANSILLDSKIGDLTGFKDQNVIEEINLSGLLSKWESANQMVNYKYLIDIDGFSNAYSGLFRRLLSGAVVLKVDSANAYRQWYYDRLIPWENFIPIKADLSDLEDVIRYLIINDEKAKYIGEQGRKLALSITYESEMPTILDKLKQLILPFDFDRILNGQLELINIDKLVKPSPTLISGHHLGCCPFLAQEKQETKPSIWLGYGLLENYQRDTSSIPAAYLYEFHNVWIAAHGCIIDDLGRMFKSRHLIAMSGAGLEMGLNRELLEPKEKKIDQVKLINKVVTRKISDPCVPLSQPGEWAYGHWLVDILPRAIFAQELGIKVKYILSIHLPDYGRKLLNLIGIQNEDIILYDPASEAIQMEICYFPSQLRQHSAFSTYFSKISEQFSSYKSACIGRKIFISRGSFNNAQTITNSFELHSLMKEYGIEIVEPHTYTIEEQIKLFSEASLVIGEYGSAMHNTVFSHPGTNVLVLQSEAPLSFIQAGIGAALNQPTGFVFGPPDKNIKDRVFHIPIPLVRQAIEEILSKLDVSPYLQPNAITFKHHSSAVSIENGAIVKEIEKKTISFPDTVNIQNAAIPTFVYHGFLETDAPKVSISPSLPENSIAITDCFVSASVLDNNLVGGLYDKGCLLENATYRGVTAKRQIDPSNINDTRIVKSKRVSGDCIYMGWISHDFGHLLLEALARFWCLNNLDVSNFSFVFHPLGNTNLPKILATDFGKIIFDSFGIQNNQIILADQDLLIENLKIPSSLLILNSAASLSQAKIYQHINNQLTGNIPLAPSHLRKKIYFSRRKLDKNQRKAINEQLVETIFQQHGFEIIFPELLGINEKIKVINETCILAGCEGSDLYFGVFLPPESKMIVLSEKSISSSQFILGAIANAENHFIRAGLKDGSNGMGHLWQADTIFIKSTLEKLYL